MRVWLQRFQTVPFEVVIGILAFVGGLTGLFKVGMASDALALLIGSWMIAFQAVYLISGALILGGLASGSRSIEAPGLVFLAVSVVVRTLALVWFFHVQSIVWVSLIFNAVIVWGCWVRVRSLTRGDVLIVLQPEDQP